ncbi:MAG: peroxiredoxin-like family protein [Rhodospirillales bacterium]
MQMIHGLLETLHRRHPGLGRAHMEALTTAARDLLDDNRALLTLQPGERVEDFTLAHADGQMIGLAQLRRAGPVVLTFFRGGWCGHCSAYLAALQRTLGDLAECGASIVAVSPQTLAWSRETAERLGLDYYVLSDPDNKVSRAFGLVYRLPEAFREAYELLAIDLPDRNGNHSFELPIPATFVIAPDGRVTFASADADYTRRPAPIDVLEEVRRITSEPAAVRS